MWFHIWRCCYFLTYIRRKNTGQRSCSYFGSGHTWPFFQQIFFQGFLHVGEIWPLLWLSPPPLSTAAPLASIISELGYLPWACACSVHTWICCAVSSSTACWEGRYLWRFCNKADTVSCLTLPQGMEGAVHCGGVGGGEETGKRARVFTFTLR